MLKTSQEIKKLIDAYNLLVKGIDNKAHNNQDRAYGGVIRAAKGILVESLAKSIVEIAWRQIGGRKNRLSLERKPIKIPINSEYIQKIRNPEVKKYIRKNIKRFYYLLKNDVHVHIDGKFVVGIECKAYTENAMLKRILVDFTLMHQVFPDLKCILLQLESQLGGDYSEISKKIHTGSYSTHTLMSYFDVNLMIITLLEGERRVDKPIHKKPHFKKLQTDNLLKTIKIFQNLLKDNL